MSSNFDTLSYSTRLQTAGLSKQIADESAQLIREMVMADLVTKSDLEAALGRQTLTFGGMLIGAVGLLLAALPFVMH